jgi:hypothetical protein
MPASIREGVGAFRSAGDKRRAESAVRGFRPALEEEVVLWGRKK